MSTFATLRDQGRRSLKAKPDDPCLRVRPSPTRHGPDPESIHAGEEVYRTVISGRLELKQLPE